MILSDVAIKELINSGEIIINPDYQEKNVRPVGVRLHIANEVLIPTPNQIVDPSKPIDLDYEKRVIPEEGFILKPNMFVLASTYEQIKVPRDVVGKLDGRSTIARLGVQVHCTSDTIDGNHDEPRSIVFEIKNIGVFDIILKPNAPLGMIVFHKLSHPIGQKSQSQYRNQTSVEAPNLKVQFE